MVSDLKRQLHSHNALLWYYSHLKAISGKADLKDAMLSESKTAQSYIITWTRSPTRWLIGHSGNTWFSGRVRWGDWQINRLPSSQITVTRRELQTYSSLRISNPHWIRPYLCRKQFAVHVLKVAFHVPFFIQLLFLVELHIHTTHGFKVVHPKTIETSFTTKS